MITTVLGEVSKDSLSVTSAHEHLLIDLRSLVDEPTDGIKEFHEKLSAENRYRIYSDPYALLDNAVIDEKDVALNELKAFYEAGGRAVVDVTLDEIGRDPQALKSLSEKSGVNIVMGCGHYIDGALPERVKQASVDELAEEMVRDLTVGACGTDIRAGVIGEIGTGKNPTKNEEKVLCAAAVASVKTGYPIHVHTSLYERNGLWVVKLLRGMGVAEKKICIDHIDVKLQPDYIEELLDFGVYVEFDNFGKEFYISARTAGILTERFAYDLERAKVVSELCKKGFAERILLANDICLKSMLRRYGGQGYAHLITSASAMMLDCGVSEKDLNTMLAVNPAEFLDR